MVGEKYIAAVRDGADGLPFLIPALGDSLDTDTILSRVDGILLTGSPSNVEPHHYDGEPSRPGTLHDPHRDETTLKLIEREKITRTLAVPAMLNFMLKVPGFQDRDLSALHSIASGASPVPVELIKTYQGLGIEIEQV